MKKVSIIVPAFNNEATVEKSLYSLLSQDFADMEIIVIDDGSSDGTLEACRRVSSSDGRIKVIHTENRGAASARNTGLSAADGKYIMFLDGDDYYLPGAVSRMAAEIEHGGCDIVGGGITLIGENGRARKTNPSFSGLYEGEALSGLYGEICRGGDGALISFIDKIYSADLLRRHGVGFPALLSGEDSVFAFEAMLCADRILFLDDFPFYGYVANPLSFTKKSMPVEKRIDFSDAFFGAMEGLLEKYGVPELSDFLTQRKALAVYDFVMCIVSEGSLSRGAKLEALKYAAQRDFYMSALSEKEIKKQKKYVRAVASLMRDGRINSVFLLANALRLAKKIIR